MTEDQISLVEDCLNSNQGLRTKEIQFLEDIYAQHEKQEELGLLYELTEPQKKWLSDIGERLGVGGLPEIEAQYDPR